MKPLLALIALTLVGCRHKPVDFVVPVASYAPPVIRCTEAVSLDGGKTWILPETIKCPTTQETKQ